MSVVASRKVNFIVLRVRNALYITRLFIIGTIRGVTSGERFKKNFYCGVGRVVTIVYKCDSSVYLDRHLLFSLHETNLPINMEITTIKQGD